MSTKSPKGAALDWADPFLPNEQLSAEERMIRDSAAAWPMTAPRLPWAKASGGLRNEKPPPVRAGV